MNERNPMTTPTPTPEQTKEAGRIIDEMHKRTLILDGSIYYKDGYEQDILSLVTERDTLRERVRVLEGELMFLRRLESLVRKCRNLTIGEAETIAALDALRALPTPGGGKKERP